jgi:primosomal protein N'
MEIPRELENILVNGMLVKVPFGWTKRLWIIFDICQTGMSQLSFQVKEILNAEYGYALFGPDLLELILWMHKYDINLYSKQLYQSQLEGKLPQK